MKIVGAISLASIAALGLCAVGVYALLKDDKKKGTAGLGQNKRKGCGTVAVNPMVDLVRMEDNLEFRLNRQDLV
ncbi:MAG: hypothetical protein MJZ30_09450 [Paludibacteraceae bacterium]|nr:hypothetical protein [Paludibacteraceae bacterium]